MSGVKQKCFGASWPLRDLFKQLIYHWTYETKLQESPAVAREDALQHNAVPVAFLTFKIIQGEWFLFRPDLKKRRIFWQFSVKNIHFLPPLFNPKFENVSLALHPQIL